MLSSVVTSEGLTLHLGRELGKGGEGSVREVGGMRGRVAKLYHRPPMVASRRSCASWPRAPTASCSLISPGRRRRCNANGIVHPCEVGVAHFTPPELQGIPAFDGVVRSTNHDNFGLARLLFHLLFGGRHPYSGVPLRSGVGEALDTDIKAFRYAYARDAVRRGLARPPRSLPACLVPPPMERMFHAAFTEAGAARSRPTADQWVEALDAMRRGLRRCRTTAMHVYPAHLSACPWCDLERQGVLHFVDLSTLGARPAAHFALARAWSRVEAIPLPPPVRAPIVDARALAPRPLPRHIPDRRTLVCCRFGVVGLVVALCAFAPQAWVLALIAGVFAWLLAQSFFDGPRALERAYRRAALDDAVQEYTQLLDRVRREAGPEGFMAKKAQLVAMRAAYEHLPGEEMRELRAARGGIAKQIAIRSRYAARAVAMQSALQRGAQELREFSEAARARAAARQAELEGAATRVAQAHKDLAAL
jgi:DNA-binding helix-hairpin-helix protein with protein kinase domain